MHMFLFSDNRLRGFSSEFVGADLFELVGYSLVQIFFVDGVDFGGLVLVVAFVGGGFKGGSVGVFFSQEQRMGFQRVSFVSHLIKI